MNCKKKCDKSIYNFSTNNLSTKMLQSKALQQNKKAKFVYKNTRVETIYKSILSLNYEINKKLLLTYKYTLYKKYFDDIQNVKKEVLDDLNFMLTSIISNLSDVERKNIFNPEPPVVIVEKEVFTPSIFTFYVITRTLSNIKYFIIKNINDTFIFKPTYSYVFDLSDPSNLGTKFSLSEKMDGVAHKGDIYEGVPGKEGGRLIVNIEKNISVYVLFVFNDNERDVKNKIKMETYDWWGYSTKYLFVNIGKSKERIVSYKFQSVEQISILSINEASGPKYLIVPVTDRTVHSDRNLYKYSLSYGTYYLTVPETYAVALINSGFESYISFGGDPNKKIVRMVNGLYYEPSKITDVNQTFYWGEVVMTIYKPLPYSFSFYSLNFGYMDGLSFINFSGTERQYPTLNPIYEKSDPLHTGIAFQTNLNVITVGVNSYFTFNNDYQYLETRKYGLYKGVYTILNIPKKYPITLLNVNKDAIVVLPEKEIIGTNIVYGLGPDGKRCKFYWGALQIEIRGDFGFLSLYSTYQGYMGGYKLFSYGSIYDNRVSYTNEASIPSVISSPSNTTFTEIFTVPVRNNLVKASPTIKSYSDFIEYLKGIVYNNVVNVINLTDNIITNVNITPNKNNSNVYVLNEGMYILFANGYDMALLNNGKTDYITYMGGLSITSTAEDNISYKYYRSTLIINVLGNFGSITLDINGVNFNGLNILCYG